jgi:hypothetical protein
MLELASSWLAARQQVASVIARVEQIEQIVKAIGAERGGSRGDRQDHEGVRFFFSLSPLFAGRRVEVRGCLSMLSGRSPRGESPHRADFAALRRATSRRRRDEVKNTPPVF